MNSRETEPPLTPRRVRICRPAFQDMHHVVMPRLSARAECRRHAMKLRFWSRQVARVADLDWFKIPSENLFVVKVTDGFGLADGFHIMFCEEMAPEPGGTICVLSVMREDEPFSCAAIDILRGREVIARERLRNWITTQDP